MPSFIQRTNEEIMQNLPDMRDIMSVEFWSFEPWEYTTYLLKEHIAP